MVSDRRGVDSVANALGTTTPMNEHPELAAGPRGVARRIVDAIVDASVARPFHVVLAALLVIVAARQYVAAGLELRSDFLELLPRDSPGFIAFEQQLRRVGGAASFFRSFSAMFVLILPAALGVTCASTPAPKTNASA